MSSNFRLLLLAVCLIVIPMLASAQFKLIQQVPGQSDDDFGTNGHEIIEAANGDTLVFIAKNGEVTNDDFPPTGTSAELRMYRSGYGGLSWSEAVVLDTAIEDNGVQGIGSPHATVLPSGKILLTYGYINDVAPNFSLTHKVLVSTDHGATWSPLQARTTETADLAVSPSGQVVSMDWVDDGAGNLSFHASTYDEGADTWTPRGLIATSDTVCSMTLHVTSNAHWTFYFGDCVFGYGGTNTTYRMVTMDSGANWSDPEELFTADSGFGNWGSVTTAGDGSLTAVYANGPLLSYRMSSDGGATWSDAVDWTGGTEQMGDNTANCNPGQFGPLCAFSGRRGSENPLVLMGVPGKSHDSLLGAAPFIINAGLNDAWFNLDTSGQGILIAVFPALKQMFIAWFTYDTERPPQDVEAMLGEPGHRWLTAQGPFDGDTANLTIFLTQGGVFDSAEPVASTDPAGDGTMTVTFTDCTAGLVSYVITSLGISGEIPIERIAPDNVGLCQTL
jgi:hypothetical protein